METLKNLDVVKILGTGMTGFAFLLAFLAFTLLKKNRRPAGAVWFMGFSTVLCLIGLGAQVFDQRLPRSEVEQMMETNEQALHKKHMQEVAQLKEHYRSMLNGKILTPAKEAVVGSTFACNGTGIDCAGDFHFWLAVEINGLVWPKEPELHLDNGRWTTRVFEDGTNDSFAVGLWVANEDAQNKIKQWLIDGKQNGRYTSICGFDGFSRLDRTGELRKRKPLIPRP